MKPFLLALILTTSPALADNTGAWALALPGWTYEFPRDHFSHPDFKTEWWYVTGRLETAGGRRIGCQFTIFRRGVRPPRDRAPVASAWVVDHLPMAHFALTDITGGTFHHAQRLERGAFGAAGFPAAGVSGPLAWVGDWQIALTPEGAFTVRAADGGQAIDLTLTPQRAPLFHGENGVSQKAAGEGNASHYYSMTRLAATGSVTTNGQSESVSGLCWLDREWATNQLSEGQAGWDWISLHLSDGRDLMLYQLRLESGGSDPQSSATLAGPDGTRHLTKSDFTLTPVPGRTWTSAETGATYPVAWQIRIPSESLDLTVSAVLDSQELAIDPVTYWEGGIDAAGTSAGTPLSGEGYLEMTGYAGKLEALQKGDK